MILNFIVEDYVFEHSYLLKCSIKKFMLVRIMLGLCAFVLFGILYFVTHNTSVLLLCVLASLFFYMYPYIQLKKYKKKKEGEIEVAITQWILQLEPLILTNTIPIAIQKSIRIAPTCIVEEVKQLSAKILNEPTNKAHYLNFCSGFQSSDMMEAMLSLHQYNFSDKDEILLDFQLLHRRMDELRTETKKKQNEEKIFFYGMILIAEPFLTMLWVLQFVMVISTQMMKAF